MGEVKRYTQFMLGLNRMMTVINEEDYAALERERDELAEQLATAITDAHDARQDDRAELTRLRAVEKAALEVVSDALADVRVHPCDEFNNEVRAQQLYGSLTALAEACGRKG